MTDFTVRVTDQAVKSIESYRSFIADDRMAPHNAQRWVDKVFQAIESLARFPRRCPLAPENRRTSYEVRMRIVGKYLILFHVDETTLTVHVLGFAKAIGDHVRAICPRSPQRHRLHPAPSPLGRNF